MHSPSQRYLFVDFDGCLHSNQATPQEWFIRAPALEHALAPSSVALVISSSWRFHFPKQEILARLPRGLADRVVGFTGDALVGTHARYHEICAWQRLHASGDFRCLDDAHWEFPRDCPQLILCNGAIGLAERELDQLRRWLEIPSASDCAAM